MLYRIDWTNIILYASRSSFYLICSLIIHLFIFLHTIIFHFYLLTFKHNDDSRNIFLNVVFLRQSWFTIDLWTKEENDGNNDKYLNMINSLKKKRILYISNRISFRIKKRMKIKFTSVKSFSKEDSLDIFINKFNIFIDYRVISVQWW